MPLVVVTRDPNVLTDEMARTLGPSIQIIVAYALGSSDPDGKLTSSDIEVRFVNIGPLDVNTKPFEVIVLANDYPQRRANLDERRAIIARELRLREDVLGVVRGRNDAFVWVCLAHGSFEFL